MKPAAKGTEARKQQKKALDVALQKWESFLIEEITSMANVPCSLCKLSSNCCSNCFVQDECYLYYCLFYEAQKLKPESELYKITNKLDRLAVMVIINCLKDLQKRLENE